MTSASTSRADEPRAGIEDRLAALIRIPTVSAERERRDDEPFRRLLDALPGLYPLAFSRLEVERLDDDHAIALHWAAGRHEREPLVLMAHFDVVPAHARDGWTHDPFAGVVADGRVHGRGALDDKGALVMTLDAIENLLAAGFEPARDVRLVLGGDEEVFGSGARRFAERMREAGIRPWLVLDEGGAIVDSPLPFVEGVAAMIGIAEKGIATIELACDGASGHASAPSGLTAAARVARAVQRIGPAPFPPRMSESARAMLRAFERNAPSRRHRALLRALHRMPGIGSRVLAAGGGEGAAAVRTTLAATMLRSGTAANVLPARATATFNMRVAPGESAADRARDLERRIRDPLVTVRVTESSPPSPQSSPTSPQYRLLREALSAVAPDVVDVPYVCLAATDSRWFHEFAPQTFRFTPLRMSKAQRAYIHGVDEHVEVASLLEGERFLRALIERMPA